MQHLEYILITPAHNESVFIEDTIKSIINQRTLPLKWVIVDDGSTDNTSSIVKPYAQKYEFIELLKLEREPNRTFASKVRAFNSGFQKVEHIDFDFIGNLDADVTFESDYYEKILTEFQNNSKLGIGGGDRYDYVNEKFEKVIRSSNSVSGAVQLFRKECFSDINGYRELDYGGIDAVAESMARFAGWEVQTFRDIIFHHHRRTGTAKNSILKAYFRNGVKEYLIGYHPLFELLRVITKITNKPFFIGSVTWLFGFCWASIRRYSRPVSKEFVMKLRAEQMQRLLTSYNKIFGFSIF